MNFGFVRIAAATPVVQVADCQHNVSHIATLVRQAASQGAAIVAFPELSITGYTCGDPVHTALPVAAGRSRPDPIAGRNGPTAAALHNRTAGSARQPALQYRRRILPGTNPRRSTEKLPAPTTTNFMKTAGSLREPNLTQNEYRSAGRKLPFRPACCSNAAMYASA